MLVNILIAVVLIYVFFKLVKFIGKKAILVVLLVGLAYLAFSQEPTKNFDTELISKEISYIK